MSNIPLRIYCKNCGAPAGFDIINQTYRCPLCGSKLIRREFSCPEQMPELIIPFSLPRMKRGKGCWTGDTRIRKRRRAEASYPA